MAFLMCFNNTSLSTIVWKQIKKTIEHKNSIFDYLVLRFFTALSLFETNWRNKETIFTEPIPLRRKLQRSKIQRI